MKRFGQNMYEIEGYTILHSGRPVPDDTDTVERNKSVGIVLYPCLAEAWRRTGEVWKGVSSRMVMARVKLYHIYVEVEDRLHGTSSDTCHYS